jgi:hypothetical protein
MAGYPTSHDETQHELDLLALLLEADPVQHADAPQAYPWNPALAEADVYFSQLEHEAIALGWFDDLAPQVEALSQTFEQLWTTTSTSASLTDRVQQLLSVNMPQHLIANIISTTQQVVSSGKTMEQQLIQSVKDCFPTIAAEDWPVFARRYAYAMRDASAESSDLEAMLSNASAQDWSEMSEMDQVKLGLAIARYSIAQQQADH